MQNCGHGLQQAMHVAGLHIADIADAEGLALGHLARVDHEAFFLQRGVKALEIPGGAVRRMKGGDDGRLQRRGQEGGESQIPHAGHEDALVVAVALVARRDAALDGEFSQCLGKGPHHVGGRGEPPFAGVGLHGLPLVEKIQAQGARLTAGVLQNFSPGDHETESRYALNALVGAADQVVHAHRRDIQGHAAETTHGVEDENAPVGLDDAGDLGCRVEHAGGGFTVHHGHVGDGGVGGKNGIHTLRIRRSQFAAVDHPVVDAATPGDVDDTPAIGPVGQNQQFPRRRDGRGHGGLHAKGAAALHQDGGVGVKGAGQTHQVVADALHQPVVIRVPGTPVA
ncbi:conserved hypothetical protein [Desulfosarcina cetonica]|nr:conserved hypothetical protein [Desulfosarcina cetonica]